MKPLLAICVATLLLCGSLPADEPSPDANEILEYTATQFFTELIGQFLNAKNDERVKRIVARRYYQNLFVLWFGTHNPPTSKTIEFDLRGNIRASYGSRRSISLKRSLITTTQWVGVSYRRTRATK